LFKEKSFEFSVKLMRGKDKWRSRISSLQCRVMEALKVATVVWVKNSKVQEHGG